MALVSDQTTSICKHCDRSIPLLNFDLHYAHCSRNLEKCNVCGDMVPRKHAEEHYRSTHAHVKCSLCGQEMEPEKLEVHESQNCPLRMVTCDYCEFPLPALDLIEHQEVCGNRTEYCGVCKKYIRLSNRLVHETTCTGISDVSAESSRLTEPEREQQPQEPQAHQRRPPARPQHHGEADRRKNILFTIAVTGVAVVIGSLFFQKKVGSSELE